MSRFPTFTESFMSRLVNHRAIACAVLLAAVPAAQAASAPSMCHRGDEAMMSCPLAKGGKTVSMCAKADKTFYYAYGKAGVKPDMVWPTDDAPSTGLTFTHLMYAGATGGNAFAFSNDGSKYVVYAISGTGFEDGGVIVRKDGQKKPVKESGCADGSKTESDKSELYDAARALPEDPDIAAHGLPRG
ncbi:hypothetical protein ABIE56_001034 [Luteibacter sp. 621]